jgi:hypothetical protein
VLAYEPTHLEVDMPNCHANILATRLVILLLTIFHAEIFKPNLLLALQAAVMVDDGGNPKRGERDIPQRARRYYGHLSARMTG